MTKLLRVSGLLALTSHLALGCGDGDGGAKVYDSVAEGAAAGVFAEEFCRLMLRTCECPTASQIFSSMSQCKDALSAQMQEEFDQAAAAGLDYHPECMAGYVNLFTQTLECRTLSELTPAELQESNAPTCKVVSGTAGEGESCEPYYQVFGDTCVQGAQCLNGMCVVYGSELAAGESCTVMDRCELDTACLGDPDQPGTSVCTPLPGLGEACTIGCKTGLYCDPVDTLCRGPGAEGEPCGQFPYECGEGLVCESDFCAQGLALGEPCTDDDQCGTGYSCDEPADGTNDVCMAEQPLVCF